VKTGAERLMEIKVPTVSEPAVDTTDLLNRTRGVWGRPRVKVERDIQQRQSGFRERSADEVPSDGYR
jgi:hypothetical protein